MALKQFILWILVLLALSYFTMKLMFLPVYAPVLSYGSDNITITRDAYNIPHIQAQTKSGAYYAMGYVMAEDRLFQMHVKRMVASGRLAEMFGQRSLPVDLMFRSIGIGYWAK